MHVRCWEMSAVLIFLAISFATASGSQPSPISLLERYAPTLCLDPDGPDGQRHDWPIKFVFGAVDGDSENNFETLRSTTGPDDFGTASYVNMTSLMSSNGVQFWLLAYHYYYPANWYDDVQGLVDVVTHEHDFEWVYVLVGLSDHSYYGHMALGAVASAHDDENLHAMERHHFYVHPQIKLSATSWEELENQGIERSDRLPMPFTYDTHKPITHLLVGVTSKGNAGKPEDYGAHLTSYGLYGEETGSWTLGESGDGNCTGATTDKKLCYGEPDCGIGCDLPFIGAGDEECGDCGSNREVPWKRSFMWDEDAIPVGFWFPPADDMDWEPSGQPAETPEVNVWPSGEGIGVSWCGVGQSEGTIYEIEVVGDGRRTQMGSVAAVEDGALAVRLVPWPIECPAEWTGVDWILRTPRAECEALTGKRIDVWECPAGGEGTRLVGSQIVPTLSCSSELRLSLWPNPVRDECVIAFRASNSEQVQLDVLSVEGRVVKRLIRGPCTSGWKQLRWNGRDEHGRMVPSGIYVARLEAGDESRSRSIIVSR